jgi:hypothetical protein
MMEVECGYSVSMYDQGRVVKKAFLNQVSYMGFIHHNLLLKGQSSHTSITSDETITITQN